MRRSLLALVLVACTGGADKADDTAAGADSGEGSDTEDTVDSTVAPVINSVDRVECDEHQSAGEAWGMDLTVTDPQGADTVSTGEVKVQNEAGGELASYVLTCRDGACSTTFRADYDGIGCSMDGTIAFVFTVTDEDGNTSAAKTHNTW